MAKSFKLEETITFLDRIELDCTPEEGIILLKQVLQSKFAIAVARAAKIVRKAELFDLLPDLVTAFERFMVNWAVTNPSCLAKKELAEALYRLEWRSRSAGFIRVLYGSAEACPYSVFAFSRKIFRSARGASL
jgi:hypothetical protein